MTSLVAVLAHPRSDSSCAALFGQVVRSAERAGAEVARQDLYADRFDPVMTGPESRAVAEGPHGSGPSTDPLVARYQRELAAADRLAVVHPNWWGKPPAILAGWLDRALAPGVAYKLEGGPAGAPVALWDLSALVVTTGDTDRAREQEEFGDPLAAIWERCVLPYIGARHHARLHVSPVSAMTLEQRRGVLADVDALVGDLMRDSERLSRRPRRT